MEIEPGARYRCYQEGMGDVEVTALEPAPGDSFPNGPPERPLAFPRWRVRTDAGEVLEAQAPDLTPLSRPAGALRAR
jgi:hypothetical protein